MGPFSIRRRLLLWLLVSLLAISALFVTATYQIERAGITHFQDQRLRRIALDIPVQLKSADLRQINVKLFHGDDDFLLQIWQGNREIYRSATDLALPPFAPLDFSLQRARWQDWKVFVRRFGGYTVQVAQSLAERDALARKRAIHLIVPLLLLIAAIALLLPLVVTLGLRSLLLISEELGTRALDRLTPLNRAGRPTEILPVVDAINMLLSRLAEASEAQLRFLADASHELRTPLAGLQLQLQLVEEARNDPQRRDALAALRSGVQRAGRLVDQLLMTSRLDANAEATMAEREILSVNTLVRDAIVQLDVLANAKGIDLGLVKDDPAEIPGHRAEIMTLLLNVIDNAIRYTPSGGQVDIAIRSGVASVAVTVDDSGPGIPPADRAYAFDRFYRAGNHSEKGSGLGLAIARRIADRHGAEVVLGDSPALGGLEVELIFHVSKEP